MRHEVEIVVVGSVNLDLVVTMPALPKPGETVLAGSYGEFVGGKGGNQAIAAARLGRGVAFVGRTGVDAAGDMVRSALAAEGIDVGQLRAIDCAATGRALVLVDNAAENSIVVVSGANAGVVAEVVQDAADLLQSAKVVVAQLEVPVEAVRAAAGHVRGILVLNPAPAQVLDDDLLARVDVLVVNEGEFAIVSGRSASEDLDEMSVTLAASALPASVVVTLGGRGALVWHAGQIETVPAPEVEVVDTTGAGDTFVGALADALARGEGLLDAVHWAVLAASLSTGSLGATTGMPTRAEVLALASAQADVYVGAYPPIRPSSITSGLLYPIEP